MPYTTQLTSPIPTNGSTKQSPTMMRMFFPRTLGGFKYKIEITPFIQQIYAFQPNPGATVGAEIRCIIKTYKRNLFGGWSLNNYTVQVTGKAQLSNINNQGAGIISFKDDIDITKTSGNPKTFKLFSNFAPNPTSPQPDILYNQQFWNEALLDIKIKMKTSDGDFEVDYV